MNRRRLIITYPLAHKVPALEGVLAALGGDAVILTDRAGGMQGREVRTVADVVAAGKMVQAPVVVVSHARPGEAPVDPALLPLCPDLTVLTPEDALRAYRSEPFLDDALGLTYDRGLARMYAELSPLTPSPRAHPAPRRRFDLPRRSLR